jgi:hypothetical protein
MLHLQLQSLYNNDRADSVGIFRRETSGRRYDSITTLDIIYRPLFYLKHYVSELEFCLHLHVERTQLGQYIELVSVSGRRCNPISETLCS